MTTEGYEYLLSAEDDMSQPITRARDAMGRFVKTLGESDAVMKKADSTYTSFFGKMGGTWGKQAESAASAVAKVGSAAEKSGHGAHTIASGISYAVRGFDDLSRGGKYAANGLLDVGKAFSRLGPYLLGAALVGGVAAISKYAFEMSELKEQTVEAYSVFTGSSGKGVGLFGAVEDLASSVHVPADALQAKTKELLELGLTDQRQLTTTVRAISDLQRVGLESGAKKIEALVERSLAAGHLVLGRGGAGASRALTGTGVSEADLAAQLGLNPKQLEAQLKAGKISVEDGLAAIDRAIIQGKVGALATKKFTVSDAFTDLHNSIRKVFQESDDSPITEAMRHLSQSFADGTDGARQLGEATDIIFIGIGKSIDAVYSFGETVNSVFDGVWNKIDWLGDKWATLGKSEEEAKAILAGRHIKRASQEIGGAVRAQDAAFEKVQNLANSGASEKEIQDTARRLGIDVSIGKAGAPVRGAREAESFTREVPGLEVGVQKFSGLNATGAVLDRDEGHTALHIGEKAVGAMRTLGENAGKALHEGAAGPEGLDAHSPSKKMYDLGIDAARGFQSGASAASDTGASPSTSARPGAGASVTVHVGGIAIHGASVPDEWMPMLESQIADVFERVAMEMGQ